MARSQSMSVTAALAYTVGFERGEVRVDGGQKRPMTIRVTHIYRRFDGAWQFVHRHADFPRQTSGRAGNNGERDGYGTGPG